MFTPIAPALSVTEEQVFGHLLNGTLFDSFQELFKEKIKFNALGGKKHPDVLKFLLLGYASKVLLRADAYAKQESQRRRSRKLGLNVYSVVAILLAVKFIFDQACLAKQVTDEAGLPYMISPLTELFSTRFLGHISIDLKYHFYPCFPDDFVPHRVFLPAKTDKPESFKWTSSLNLAEKDLLRLVNDELPADCASFLANEELLQAFIKRLYQTSTSAAQEKYFQEVRDAIQAMREELKVPKIPETVPTVPAVEEQFLQPVDECFVNPLLEDLRIENQADGDSPAIVIKCGRTG